MKIKFWQLISVSFFILSLVASTIGSYVYYLEFTNILIEETLNHLETTVQSRAHHIETYFEQTISRLKLITSRTRLREVLQEYNVEPTEQHLGQMINILNDVLWSIDDFEKICIIGVNGITITSTNSDDCGFDVHDKKFFIKGKDKEDIYFDKEYGVDKLFVSGPIELDGRLLGVVVVVLNLNYLTSIIKDNTGLLNTGEVLIAYKDDMGNQIFPIERLFELEAVGLEELEGIALPMKFALENKRESFDGVLDYRGISVIASSSYVTRGKVGVVAKIDKDESIDLVKDRILKLAFWIIFTITMIVTIIGHFISIFLSKPIYRLAKNVDDISKGKLDIELEISNVFEIQKLTDSLNRVLSSLKLAILKTGVTKSELGLGEAIKARKTAEKKYKQLYENSADALMMLDPQKLKFIGANPATLSIFGIKSENEFVSKTPWEYSPKKQPDGQLSKIKAKKMIDIAMKKGTNFFEWTHKRLNGEEFSATVLLTKVKENGNSFILATVRDISELEKTKQGLEKEKNFLTTVIKHNPHSIIIYNTKGEFIDSNDAFKKLFGANPSKEYNLFTDKMLKKAGKLEIIKQVLDGKTVKIEPFWYDTQEAALGLPHKVIYVSAIIQPIKDVNGKIFRIVIMHEDFTKQEIIQKKYENIIKNVKDLVFSFDPETLKLLFISENSKELTGYSPKEVLGKKITDFIHPDDISQVNEDLKLSMSKGKDFPTKFRIKTTKGYVEAEELGKLIRENGKLIINGVIRIKLKHGLFKPKHL